MTRRAILDILRGAVLGSYGVTGVDAGWLERLRGRLGLGEPGIRVRLDRGIEIDLHLTVGYGVPVAEVARQIDSAVRYAIRHAVDREVRRVTVHVGGLRYQPASLPPRPSAEPASGGGSRNGSGGDGARPSATAATAGGPVQTPAAGPGDDAPVGSSATAAAPRPARRRRRAKGGDGT